MAYEVPKEVVLKVEEAVVGAGQVRIYSAFAPDSFSTSLELPHHHQEGEEDLRGPEEVEKTDLAVEEDHLEDQM